MYVRWCQFVLYQRWASHLPVLVLLCCPRGTNGRPMVLKVLRLSISPIYLLKNFSYSRNSSENRLEPTFPIFAGHLSGSNRMIGLADELGSGMWDFMKYGQAYGGEIPQLLIEDVFRIVVQTPSIEHNPPSHPSSHPPRYSLVVRKRYLSYCSTDSWSTANSSYRSSHRSSHRSRYQSKSWSVETIECIHWRAYQGRAYDKTIVVSSFNLFKPIYETFAGTRTSWNDDSRQTQQSKSKIQINFKRRSNKNKFSVAIACMLFGHVFGQNSCKVTFVRVGKVWEWRLSVWDCWYIRM